MKKKIITLLVVIGLILPCFGFMTIQTASAQGASMYAPGKQYRYNFRFQLRNQERLIRTDSDYYQLLKDLIEYLLELQASLDDLNSEVEITTKSATDIEDDQALLRGAVSDFNDSDYAIVWFQYGRSNSLTSKTTTEKIYDSEDGDFERLVTGLGDDTRYYFRAVGKDDNGKIDYGNTLSFTTGGTSNDNEPDATTQSATNVSDSSAVLRGEIDMNDFNNGRAFFVYGEDEDQIDNVPGDYDTYSEVNEDGDNLQKILVDTDIDDVGYYQEKVTSLNINTEYFFRICVQYENIDNDDVMSCGSVRSFKTDS